MEALCLDDTEARGVRRTSCDGDLAYADKGGEEGMPPTDDVKLTDRPNVFTF